MQYGPLPADETSFAAASLLLAAHPLYSTRPLRLLVSMHAKIRQRQTFAAVDAQRLVGLITWHDVPPGFAIEAIRKRKMPSGERRPEGEGGALVLSSFVAPSHQDALPFFRKFTARHRGKIIVMERHFDGRESRFMWIDRAGRVRGNDLGAS